MFTECWVVVEKAEVTHAFLYNNVVACISDEETHIPMYLPLYTFYWKINYDASSDSVLSLYVIESHTLPQSSLPWEPAELSPKISYVNWSHKMQTKDLPVSHWSSKRFINSVLLSNKMSANRLTG